jgi:hypothetical protein
MMHTAVSWTVPTLYQQATPQVQQYPASYAVLSVAGQGSAQLVLPAYSSNSMRSERCRRWCTLRTKTAALVVGVYWQTHRKQLY